MDHPTSITTSITTHEPDPDYDSGSELQYDLPDVNGVIERLNDVSVTSCRDSDVISSLSDSDCSKTGSSESSSIGATSNCESFVIKPFMEDTHNNENNNLSKQASNVRRASKTDDVKTRRVSVDSKRRCSTDSKSSASNSVKEFIKKITAKSKSSRDKPDHMLHTVVVDKLPQVFIVKYLGKRECKGLWGVKHVRKPVDEMVSGVMKQLNDDVKSVELPLLYAVVSPKGIDLRPHKNNQINFQDSHIPIEFISYGVQDVKFWRVFTVIVVQEMSCRSKTLECHAFICDTPVAARTAALSLAMAFNVYMKQLESQGKQHRFQVELRPPDELGDTDNHDGGDEEDC